MEADAAYYSRRAVEERAAARKTANSTARQAHLDLAKRYEEFANGDRVS